LSEQRGVAVPTGDRHLVEQVLSGEELLHGSFLRVRRDTVRLPDGGQSTREYVVHNGAVMVVALIDGPDGLQVVMERQYRHPIGKVVVEFPAGKRDGSEDLLLCAQRELREETGFVASEWAHAGVLHPLVAYSTEFIDLWFARGLVAGPRQLDAGEFLDVITVSPADLLQWCRDGRVTDGKTVAAALWVQNLVSGAWVLDWQTDGAASAAG